MKNTATFTIFEDADLETLTMVDEEETNGNAKSAAEIERHLAAVEQLMAGMSIPNDTMLANLSAMRQVYEASKTKLLEFKEKEQQVVRSAKEKTIRDVLKQLSHAEVVDMAFIVDGTGSMQSYIEKTKSSIRSIVNQVRLTNSGLTLRLAVVIYRDLGDLQRFQVLDFVTTPDHFECFLTSITAIGGADAPEDMAGGIQQANGLNWRSPTRLAFVIADAPCHGRAYHTSEDNYPDGTPGICINKEFKKLQSNVHENGTMSLHFGRITTQTDFMIEVLQSSGIDIASVDMHDDKQFKQAATTSIRASIFKTFALTGADHSSHPAYPSRPGEGRSVASSRLLKSYSIVARAPSVAHEWGSPVGVHVFHNRPIRKITDLQAPLTYGIITFERARTDLTKKSNMFLQSATSPFAEGEIRIAFHGRLARNQAELQLSDSAMVLKSFKHLGKGINDRKRYLEQMEVSNIAHFLAQEYNKTVRPPHCSSVHVLQACVVEEEGEENEGNGSRRFCAEKALPLSAVFQKFSNNTGYWKEDILDESLLRFAKFSREATKGYLMVTDLQGVKKDGIFYLTDPVILCQDVMRFGNTNLGPKFMEKCIAATDALLSENGWS